MPARTSRGRDSWACPAALRNGKSFEVVVAVVVGSLVAVVCRVLGARVVAAGTVLAAVVVGTTGAGALVVDGDGTGALVGAGGTGTLRVVGTGSGAGTVGVDIIVVGPPTGPEQISPTSQHPMMPLLARAQ